MVSDSNMLQSISNQEALAVTPTRDQPILEESGGKPEKPQITPASGTLDEENFVAKGIAEQRSAEYASLAQQNMDSFSLNNNKSPREVDPFSTAGTVFNSRG